MYKRELIDKKKENNKEKNNENLDKTFYVLEKTNDNYDDYSSVILGIFSSREKAIEKMYKCAKYTMDRHPEYTFKNPDLKHNFENLHGITPKYYDYNNIFIYICEDYYYHTGEKIYEYNPWKITINYSKYKHNCGNKNVKEFIKDYFGYDINLFQGHNFEDYYGIYLLSDAFKICFKSLVEKPEYVIGVLTKLFNVLDPEGSNPTSENYEKSELYTLIQAITTKNFNFIKIPSCNISPGRVGDDDVYIIKKFEVDK